MPVLTVRSFAEMINLPMYSQYKILHEQKYPKDEANVYKMPYYKPSLDLIKKYYLNGNNTDLLTEWLQYNANSIRPQSKQIHNKRVISQFIQSPVSNRKLKITNSKFAITANPKSEVELKLRFDIEALENNIHTYQFINFRATKLDEKIAKDTLYLSYWVMEHNKIDCKINQLEYIDLYSNAIYKVKRQSSNAIKNMTNNTNVVIALWNSI